MGNKKTFAALMLESQLDEAGLGTALKQTGKDIGRALTGKGGSRGDASKADYAAHAKERGIEGNKFASKLWKGKSKTSAKEPEKKARSIETTPAEHGKLANYHADQARAHDEAHRHHSVEATKNLALHHAATGGRGPSEHYHKAIEHTGKALEARHQNMQHSTAAEFHRKRAGGGGGGGGQQGGNQGGNRPLPAHNANRPEGRQVSPEAAAVAAKMLHGNR